MPNPSKVFRSNTIMILIPGIFFGAALILRGREDLSTLVWILLAVGVLTTLVIVLSFSTIIITDDEIGIKSLKKSHVIKKSDISSQTRTTSFSKGLESTVWKLHLKNGETVNISSDLFKEPERLTKSIDEFLTNIPQK